MATINLLPWRELRRDQLKKQFFIILVLTICLSGLLLFGWYSYINKQLNQQNGRNQFLQSKIDHLNQQVKEIAQLKKQKKELVARMNVIQALQGNRPEIVHIFDEMVRVLPDGVYFDSLNRVGNQLTIKGSAESNNRISSLMRQLDASQWFKSPNLLEVKAKKKQGETANDFVLTVQIDSPSAIKAKG